MLRTNPSACPDMPQLDADTRIRRNPGLLASNMDGDLVMMDAERGQYYGISGVGTRIWALLEQPTTATALAEVIQQEYKIDAGTALHDVMAFVSDLARQGLVQTA